MLCFRVAAREFIYRQNETKKQPNKKAPNSRDSGKGAFSSAAVLAGYAEPAGSATYVAVVPRPEPL